VLKKKQMSNETKKEFLAEMELLSKLDHPNIIKVYELYYYNYFYYVVTEFCKGGTILNYINDHSNYGEKFVSKIIKQLLSALMYLHQNCIVHLDIKLENVVFLEKCHSAEDKVYIKLIDFGCSKHFIPFKKKKAKISGTLSYIAPECLQGYYS
jgi:calcium-dependent protein kinase